jgi:type IV pilus assembly protein PilQ
MARSRRHGFFIAVFLILLGIAWTPPAEAQRRISLDVRNADVRETLRLPPRAGGLNVVIGPDVAGTVTLRLRDAPVDDALEIVLNTAGLVQVREGTTVGILSRETWLRQRRQQVERHTMGVGRTRVAVIPLWYAKAAELAPLLATLLSPWGTIAVDERTNSLIVRDIAESPLFQQHEGTP